MKPTTRANKSAGFGFGGLSTSSTTLSYIAPPPNLSHVPVDIIVPFKNLLKKDSITKQKALEDIVSYVKAHPIENGGIQDSVLDAWCQLYARISIDNSRRVRELSHIVLLELLKSTKKRMESRLSPLVGAWLAGAFDRDKAVSRAATDGFSLLADTEEKITKVWNKAQSRIMDYATEAIRETSDTLSDERSTTKEDAEAKYHRVVASSLSLVLNLMKRAADLDKLQDRLSEYLANETVWNLAASEDFFVRRSLYQLLQACLDANPELLKPQLPQIGRVLIQQCLRGNQSNSATELVKILTSLTKVFPEIWRTKKLALEFVKPFVAKGSQGSSSAYWVELKGLLLSLPGPAPSPDLAAVFLQSLRKGISSRGEPMASIPHAWSCYLSVFEKVIAGFTPDTSFLQANIFPLTEQFLYPRPELSEWSSVAGAQFIPKAWDILNGHSYAEVRESAHREWQRLSDMFISELKSALPEVSKDHQKSQDKIAATGDRWYTLAAALLRDLGRHGSQSEGQPERDSGEHLTDTIVSSSVKIIEAGRELLMRRNFKPFGAASVIQSAFKKCPALAGDGSLIASLFPTDNAEQVQTLVGSPSLAYLVPCLEQLAGIQRGRFESVWNELVEAACVTQDIITSQSAVNLLISIPSAFTPSRHQQHLQGYLISALTDCAKGNKSSSWELFESAASSALDEPALKSLVGAIVGVMGEGGDRTAVLKAIDILARKSTAGSLLTDDQHLQMQLVTNLLAMTELSGGPESDRAVRELLDSQPAPGGNDVLKEIIQKSLDDAGLSSLKINTLLQEADQALKSNTVPIEELLPNTNVWIRELTYFLEAIPDPSLSLTSRLGGAYFLVGEGKKGASARQVRSTPKRDKQGRSIPARMAIYTSKILSGDKLSSLPKDLQVEILYLLGLTIELADDQLTSLVAGGLWDNVGEEVVMAEIQELSTQSRRIIIGVARQASEPEDWKEADMDGDGLIPRLTTVMLGQMRVFNPLALYSAKALSHLFETLIEIQGPPSSPRLEAWFQRSGALLPTREATLSAIAFIAGFQEKLAESKTAIRLCAVMISELSATIRVLDRTLYPLVLLNASISVYETGKLPVGNHKQVLALKELTSLMTTSDETNFNLAAELFKAVHQIFPNVKHVYGPYWETIISSCLDLWNRAAEYPPNATLSCIQASIKLMLALEIEAETEANDDLVEALAKYSQLKSTRLIGLLKLPRGNTQVGSNVDSLLSRCVQRIPLDHIVDLSGLYGLVASESRPIQSAAFGLLHRALPEAQGEIAVDSALEKTQARLSDELLSLFLDAPTLESYHDVLGQFPAAVRSYLLGWHLVFDAYSTAPQRLRDDYTECIKSQNILNSLLDFTFDVLGHSAANPLNLDKEGLTQDLVKNYDIKLAESEDEEKNMHWLLVHICYMTLKYLPGLFRTWYLNCESKQTKNAVKIWTTKYLSSLLISESLDDVAAWHSRQEPPEDDEKELNIKISKAAREVTAEYEIDEEFCAILIRIPVEYPLEMVEVVGLNRVAVDENKWKHWILTTQGVITFANGSIADGLAAFRRNIIGLLKGHTECAICYSIVATDKKLPDKECRTCHHMYHRLCLYKWFQNSGRNTCPLCRMPIEYLGSSDRAKRTGREG